MFPNSELISSRGQACSSTCPERHSWRSSSHRRRGRWRRRRGQRRCRRGRWSRGKEPSRQSRYLQE